MVICPGFGGEKTKPISEARRDGEQARRHKGKAIRQKYEGKMPNNANFRIESVQNKANLQKGQMRLNTFTAKTYTTSPLRGLRKNKANSKPILRHIVDSGSSIERGSGQAGKLG